VNRAIGPSPIAQRPARRFQRVAFNIFLCFLRRMRLRRFLISDPMWAETLADGPWRRPTESAGSVVAGGG
jgi:hypothetical protein